MVYSASAQLQWRALPSIPTNSNNQRFDDVFFLNDNVGWACNGGYAAIYKTVDGGQNWQLQLSEYSAALPGHHYFRNVEFLNENIGFLGTLNNQFLKTVDGGTTWNYVTAFGNNTQSICGIDAVGTSTVYGCGAYFSGPITPTSPATPCYVIKSTDSGQTWEYKDMSAYANALVEVLFVDENTGYVAGNDSAGGVILKTTDGGTTWNAIYHSNVAGEYVWKLQVLFSNPNVIFGSVESVEPYLGKFIKSTDNGATWVTKNAPETIIQAVGFISENHGWMGGHTTGFYETTDGGDTWTNTGVGNNLNRIFIINDHLAYASGSTMYKFSDTPLATNDFKESSRIPLKASVEPNPVKDKLNVKIEFPESDHLIIDLYDGAGHHIKMLQKDDISTKSMKQYSLDFPYPAGIYLLDIHTNTGRQSLKFVK